jgi:hypothetical protein
VNPSHDPSPPPRSLSPEEFPKTPTVSDDEPPAALISPIKHRQKQAAPVVSRMSDLDVWGMSDQEIIGVLLNYL